MSNPTTRNFSIELFRAGLSIELQPLALHHAEALHAFKNRNRAFLQPFSPLQSEEHFSLDAQTSIVRQAIREASLDEAYRFGIVHSASGELIGQLNLTGIARGAFQNALLGYSLDERYNGKGYMTEAVRLCLELAFGALGLHRVQAAVMPHNRGSIRVLQKNGFSEEGYARQYLRINGAWEDHVLFARVNDSWVD